MEGGENRTRDPKPICSAVVAIFAKAVVRWVAISAKAVVRWVAGKMLINLLP